MRRAAAALAAALALLAAGCGGDSPRPSHPTSAAARSGVRETEGDSPLGSGVSQRLVGEGAWAAWVLRPRRGAATGRTVLFLHGWTATSPRSYGPWLEHLVRTGHAVVYPVYQVPPYLSPQTAFRGVVAGVRAALRAEPGLRAGDWLAVGHSAGGAMAVDYAAAARALGLPVPADVVSLYPGRKLKRLPPRLPEVDPRTIPETTRLTVFAGARDEVVGTAPARRIARQTGARLVLVGDPAIADHLGPQRDGPRTRARFWRFVDRALR